MSKRVEIINAVRSLLRKGGLCSGRVYSSRVKSLDLELIPSIYVGIHRETNEVFSQTNCLQLKRDPILTVEVRVEGEENAEECLHTIASQIERLLLADDSISNLVSRIAPDEIEIGVNLESETPIGCAVLRFNVSYYERFEPTDKVYSLDNIEVGIHV